MLSSCISRAVQILRLDTSFTNDENMPPSSIEARIEEESRRRLFWASWVIDGLSGTGIDRLLTLSRSLPQIPLPCAESEFVSGQKTTPGRLYTERLDPTLQPSASLEACYVRMMHLRTLILRAIRDGNPSPLPWTQDSAWAHLVALCEQWEHDLPSHMPQASISGSRPAYSRKPRVSRRHSSRYL